MLLYFSEFFQYIASAFEICYSHDRLLPSYWVDSYFPCLKLVGLWIFLFIGGPQPPQQPGQQQPYNYPAYGGYGGQPGGPDNQ